MSIDTNNDFLHDIAGEVRDSLQSNNDLLKKILAAGTGGGVVRQPAIGELDEFASEAEMINKINELVATLEAAKVTE